MKYTYEERGKFVFSKPHNEKTSEAGMTILDNLSVINEILEENDIHDKILDKHIEEIFDIIVKKLIWK